MRNSIFKKYFLNISAVILISIFCLGSVLLLILSKNIQQNSRETMLDLYNNFMSVVREKSILGDEEKLEAYTKDFLDKNDCDILVISEFGEVIYFSQGETSRTPRFISVPAFNTLNYSPNYFNNQIPGFYDDNDVHAVSSLVDYDDDKFCLIFVKEDVSERISMINVIKIFTISLAIIMVFVVLITYFATKSAVNPILKISEVANKFSKGDFSRRIILDEDNEFGDMAQALNNMANSLEKSETIRNSFVANVSHELRTPMTSIGGFVDGILDGTIPQDQQRKYLRMVSDEIRRLTKLVFSMLNMAKIENGEVKLNKTRFDMLSTIVSCLSTFEKQIDAKGVEICGLDIGKIMVYADSDLLYQVVYNLIENAIKFVNKNGYIEFQFEKSDNEFLFKIINSGEGISSDELPLIFDKFYKTDKSRGLDKTGMGIGLYLSTSIIRLHEGNISVKSSEGVSTEFSFKIPQ